MIQQNVDLIFAKSEGFNETKIAPEGIKTAPMTTRNAAMMSDSSIVAKEGVNILETEFGKDCNEGCCNSRE